MQHICLRVLCAFVMQIESVSVPELFNPKSTLCSCAQRAQTGMHFAVCLRLEAAEWQLLRAQGRGRGRGWDSVMDNDSQQARSRAQPQAPGFSPAVVGGIPTWSWGETRGANTDVKQEKEITGVLRRLRVWLFQVNFFVCHVFTACSGWGWFWRDEIRAKICPGAQRLIYAHVPHREFSLFKFYQRDDFCKKWTDSRWFLM